jgi:hypothetical protein
MFPSPIEIAVLQQFFKILLRLSSKSFPFTIDYNIPNSIPLCTSFSKMAAAAFSSKYGLQVSKIEGQKFSIVTDSNGQFSFSGKIKKSFKTGTFAAAVSVSAQGYDSVSKIATFKVK